jgi:hypothetical protein
LEKRPSWSRSKAPVRRRQRWCQHDRLLRQNFGLAGVGATWQFGERWALSGLRSWMVWGDSIHDTDDACEILVRRGF